VERLAIEAGGNTFTVDLHRKLTVVAGMGAVERESLIGELIGSLAGTRPGVHLEVEDDRGRHLAVFRPHGAAARVVDVDTVQDVSREFRGSDGRLDLLARIGIDHKRARQLMRLTAADLTTTSNADTAIDALASVDQNQLWDAAERLRLADDQLTFEAEAMGSAPEDAEIIDRIERHHAEFEAAIERRDQLRFWSVYGGGLCAIASVPAALTMPLLAIPLLLTAIVLTSLSLWFQLKMVRAQRAEERALVEAGAQSYLGFHLQRVNGLLASDSHRKRLMVAADERRVAITLWQRYAGEVPLDWALVHRDEVLAAARMRRSAIALDHLAAEPPSIPRDLTTELAHTLVDRIGAVRSAGTKGESLPLILDDPFRAADPAVKPLLLELLGTAAGAQIVYLTGDEDVASWARLEALTGDLSIIEPAPAAPEPTRSGRLRHSR
jgi:hypothetical protein